jgi:RNA recognition motif-containing protein
MPIGKKTKVSFGYAFADFETPAAAVEFIKTFENRKWQGSSKVSTVGYAKLQGFEQNLNFHSDPKMTAKMVRLPWIAPNRVSI